MFLLFFNLVPILMFDYPPILTYIVHVVEVLLVVAPKGEDMTFVEKICDSVGQGTCVVLLNARLETARFPGGESQEAFFLETFEPVFQLKPPPTQARCGYICWQKE